MDSDEQIFDTSSLQGDSLSCHFPFIDSISSILQQLSPGEPPIFFGGVETSYVGLQGIYDYSFSRQIDNGILVTVWQVIDKTESYIEKRNEQQERQDEIIRGQY